MKRWVFVAAVFIAGCSGKSSTPTAPTPVTATPTTPTPVSPTPLPTTITIRGLVRSIVDQRPIAGATVAIIFSGQVAVTTTDGTYALTFEPRAGVPTTTLQISGAPLAVTRTEDIRNSDGVFTTHDVIPAGTGFDLAFYRQFALNGLESPASLQPLRRQAEAPRIYLRTIDDAGAAIDIFTLNETARALESTAGSLTGVFGLAGLERGTDSREGQRGWITVRWSSTPEVINATSNVCGRGVVGGGLITLYPKSAGCRCAGGPAVSLSTVKHELGHTLGFWHTDAREDLMYRSLTSCDQNPSSREIFHARVAYSQPLGSFEPK